MRRHFDDGRGGARMHREDAPRYRFDTDLWRIVGVAPISFYAETAGCVFVLSVRETIK